MIHSHWHSKKHHEFPVAGPASIGGINSWSEPGRHIRNLKDQMKTSCHLLAYLWNTKQQTQCSAQTEIPIYITIYIPMISSSIFTNIHCLVGGDWNMNFMTFHSVGNGIIHPTDFNSIIFQRGRAKNHQPVYVYIYVSTTINHHYIINH